MARTGAAAADSPSEPRGDVAWHTLSTEEVARRLEVDPRCGLARAEVASRCARFGTNLLREAKKRGVFGIFAAQFRSFLILLLILAAAVAGAIGAPRDTLAILAIVVLNAAVGFVQELRAERAVAALRQLAAPLARVRRGGEIADVPAAQLVPGDVVLLEAGNLVPADLRLLECHELDVDEAALTGESQPAAKSPHALAALDLALGDRRDLAFKGTRVVRGRGVGLVVATGMASELGRIATLLETQGDVATPLQRRLGRFGQRLGALALVLCALVFALGLLAGEPIALVFLTAVSLAVAAVPEALPAVVTVSLALGARRLARANALVRHLPAVEALGSVTTICSDKTGTITEGRMRVAEIRAGASGAMAPAGDAARTTLLRALALSNDAERRSDGVPLGDPTEIALLDAAEAEGFDKAGLLEAAPRLAELPFDPERKRMTTLHRDGDGVLGFTKGAPEAVLERCRAAALAQGEGPLAREALHARAAEMAERGLRVLAFACRRWPALPEERSPEGVERELVFLGLVGLADPPRAEVPAAVARCRSAGIRPVLVTGDHPATARAVARAVGIAAPQDLVMTGSELASLPFETLAAAAPRIQVFARVAPEHKLRLVKALQQSGELVAMTGDGVNDAPALKCADIGVAMGITGTDVAKEAGDLILLDDDFATIVTAVEEGRRSFDNIRKFVKFVLAGNLGEILTILLAQLAGLPLPLLPIQILWVNLATDGLPGLALALEPAERDVMRRPPRPPNESLFARGLWEHVLGIGALIGTLCLVTHAFAGSIGSESRRTMVFTVLTLAQMGHVLGLRSERESLLRQGVASNPLLLAAVLVTVALQLCLVYVPFLQPVFGTRSLSGFELGFCLLASLPPFAAAELEKWALRRGWLYAAPRGPRAEAA